MDPNGRGDHNQVQAAAGRAVGGGPPSSATALASAATSFLPPPAPLAVDAAVQPRAADSEDPTPPPASATATATGVNNPPSDDEMENIGRDDGAPVPPVQTDAEYEEMENTIRRSVAQTQSEDAPLPPLQIAALVDKERGNDETDAKKKPAPTTEADEGSPPRSAATSPPQVQDEAIPTRIPSVDPLASPLPSADDGQSLQSREQQIPIRPPPQSMMLSPDDDTDPPVSALLHDPSVPRLRATLVEDQPEIPVYDAIQVAEQTHFEKNKKLIIALGTGLLIGAAVATGILISPNNGSSDSDTIEPEVVVLSTARPSDSPSPSDSSSPSDVPSQRPTLRPSTAPPSESSSPSQFPSVRPTLQPSRSTNPSQSPSRSLIPSLYPSTSAYPTPFCFGGEINILTDSYPDETSWTIWKIDNVDGVASSKILLNGSPEKEDYLTSDEACLARGDYEFAIFDSYGDGIVSPGYYSVAFEGVVIAKGGNFESEDKVSFSLPLPSPPPSESSSPSEHPSASFHPSESTVPSQFPSFRPSVQPSNSFSPSTYWSALNWSRQGLGFDGDASGGFFGQAVAFSADASTLAIGAPGYWDDDDSPGYVKVYGRAGDRSSWQQRGDTIRGEANGDNFGSSLALSEDGTTLSIGAPFHDSVGSNSGQVKVYEWDKATLNYVQIGDTLYGTASGDEFGWSLDISNDKILAVGARSSDANGIWSGQVTIYAWDDASSDFQQRGRAINGDAADDEFGRSVSLAQNGQKLAVGAPYNDSNGSDSGQVRVFEWDGATSNYEQLGDSLLGDTAGDRFGVSVSFSRDGTTLGIGAPFNAKNGLLSGQVKVFAWDEAASNFEQIGQSLYGKAADDEFGSLVTLSSAGKTLAVGAPQIFGPGYVEVYGWDEAASEYKRHGQSLGGEASDDDFGDALALAGNGRDLVIGTPDNGRNGTLSGRVEVFNIEL